MQSIRVFMSLAAVGLLTCACGGSGGGSGDSSQSTKSIFSKWSSGAKTMDLSGGQFNSIMLMYFAMSAGAICKADMMMIGDNSSGTWVISGSTLYSGSSDPGCSELNGSGTYTDSQSALTICRNTPIQNCSDWD